MKSIFRNKKHTLNRDLLRKIGGVLFISIIFLSISLQSTDQFKHTKVKHCTEKSIHFDSHEEHCDFCDMSPILVDRLVKSYKLSFYPNFKENLSTFKNSSKNNEIDCNFSLRAPPKMS